jgi:hypothetical protein
MYSQLPRVLQDRLTNYEDNRLRELDR